MAATSSIQASPLPRDYRFRLAAACLIGLAMFALMPLDRMWHGQNDFVHWYVGGLLFGTPQLHEEGPNQLKQIQLIGAVLNDSYFIRPTFYGLLLKPLTLFPYRIAYLLYQLYSLACIAFFLRIYSRRMPDLLIYAAMSIPLIANVVNGQDVTTLLLLCTISLLLAERRRDFLAGLVFSLCAIKFHLFILTPVAMLVHKRWRLFWGAAIGEVALFLIGLSGGGWKVFLSLVAVLSKPKNHPYPELMPNLRGLAYSIGGGSTAILVMLFVTVLAAALYLIVRSPSYPQGFAYAVMAGLLINFHAYIQDPSLLLLCAPLLLDGSESKPFRLTYHFLLLPVPYLLLLYQRPWSGLFAALLTALLVMAAWQRLRDARALDRPTFTRRFLKRLEFDRVACLIRCSFSTSENRTCPSPSGPNPMPGDTATSASAISNFENSSEPACRYF